MIGIDFEDEFERFTCDGLYKLRPLLEDTSINLLDINDDIIKVAFTKRLLNCFKRLLKIANDEVDN